MLSCGKKVLNWREELNDEENLPVELIFNFAEWQKKENYKKIVREEEDVDLFNNQGQFKMKDEFDIVILSDVADIKNTSDPRADFKSKIPNFPDYFECFFVSKTEGAAA